MVDTNTPFFKQRLMGEHKCYNCDTSPIACATAYKPGCIAQSTSKYLQCYVFGSVTIFQGCLTIYLPTYVQVLAYLLQSSNLDTKPHVTQKVCILYYSSDLLYVHHHFMIDTDSA